MLEINPGDARALDIRDNDTVQVSSATGAMTITAKIIARQSPGAVFIPYHFLSPAAQELASATQLQTRVKIEKRTETSL
jgi:anaerobic selenocysteine-containing dehydrogenase